MDSFAFITHPKHEREFAENFFAARFLPGFLISRVMKVCPPYRLVDIKSVASKHNRVSGWVISSPLITDMIVKNESHAVKKVLAASRVAKKLGAKIIGLGKDLSHIEGLAGIITKQMSIPVTTGKSYKIYALIEGLKMAAAQRGLELGRAHVLITGAASDIGKICAGLVANEVHTMTLYSDNKKQTEKMAKQILYDSGLVARTGVNLRRAVEEADIIIGASDEFPEIDSNCLKSGTIVFDIFSLRKNLANTAGKRNDVMVIEEIYIKGNGGIDFGKDTGLPKDMIDSGMAEVVILSLEKRYHSFTLSNAIKISQVSDIGRLAQKHGFSVSGFLTNYNGERIKNSITGKSILSETL